MTTKSTNPLFDTDEPLWYNNGKWGKAGYAVPNPGGKTWTINPVIYQLHTLIGRNMFELCHRQDAKFYTAPHKQFWYELHQLIITARKRMADRVRLPNDGNGLEVQHANPVPQVFLAFPVPYFGERIRQSDIREYTQLSLMLLSEIMQHSDNERTAYITPAFAGIVGKYTQEILALFSTKYFGKTREQAYAPDFALVDADFQNYDPTKVMTTVEMTEERQPLQWWPSENDLSQIRGIQINEALDLCERWPVTNWRDMADGNAWPDPNNQESETNTNANGTIGGGSTGGTLDASFQKLPGQSP